MCDRTRCNFANTRNPNSGRSFPVWNFNGRRYQSLWILYIILLSLCTDHFKSVVSCEFNFGYETEDYLSAVINLTYVDPITGMVVHENLDMGKLLPGKTDEVSGVVVHVTSNNHTSHDACDKLDTNIIPREPFIALIKRGNCRDQIKLRHVADENASAAVLYSDNHSTRFIKVERKANRITFVVISEKKGEEIAALVDNGTRVLMRIGVGPRGMFRFGQINRTSILFVSISFILLMLISFAWLVFYYVQRFRYIHAKEVLSRRLCSAAKKALDKIPVQTVKNDDSEREDEYECCAICIESFQHGELIRSLPCNHCFHKSCIDPWLLEQRSCPMCKLDILLHFGLVYTGSQESVLDLDEDEFFAQRPSLTEHDIVLVQRNQRRASSVRIAMTRPRGEDRTTSPCSFSSLNPDADMDPSFVSVAVDMSDVAVNTSDPPSEADYESSEERWTSPFPKKLTRRARSDSRESVASASGTCMLSTKREMYDVCDLTFEKD